MTIKARPNSNGNTRGHFIDAYKDMTNLRAAIMTVRSSMSCDVIHPRNYTDQGDYEQDITMLRDKLNTMMDALDELHTDLFNAIQGD